MEKYSLVDLTLIINIISRDYKNFTNCLWSFYDTVNDGVNVLISIPEYSKSQERIFEYGDIYNCDVVKSSQWISPNSIRNLGRSISDTKNYLYIEDTTIFKDEYIFYKIREMMEEKQYVLFNNRCVAYTKEYYFNINFTGYGYENFCLNKGERINPIDGLSQRHYDFHDKEKMKNNLNLAYETLDLSGEKRNYFQLY